MEWQAEVEAARRPRPRQGQARAPRKRNTQESGRGKAYPPPGKPGQGRPRAPRGIWIPAGGHREVREAAAGMEV